MNAPASGADRLTFSVFADLHYKEAMYASSVADLEQILDRAHDAQAEFVIHCGDFSNHYAGSPELTNAYLHNRYGLPVYGLYGNHELETAENSMQVVTPLLTNRDVVWGTADGKIGNGSIGYYYFDHNSFRIVCVDTNYSLSPDGVWEHNRQGSFGPPAENTRGGSLNPTQLAWLEDVLTDAAHKGLCCLVFAHESFSSYWTASTDRDAVRALYRKVNAIRPHTVLLSVNGHLHSNHWAIEDNILFFDVNTVRNGYWMLTGGQHHYLPGQTYMLTKYDDAGKEIETTEIEVRKIWQSPNTWFFNDPLNAIFTVSTDGEVTVDGMQSSWMFDINPGKEAGGYIPAISSLHAHLS